MRDDLRRKVRDVYERDFPEWRDDTWIATYLAGVRAAQEVSEAEFKEPAFQKRLWEANDVAGAGPGNSVVVAGAYADAQIVEAFWSLRNWRAPENTLERARALDAEFERILTLVHPRHNARRPVAKLARIFAMLRPYDVLCILDQWRTRQLRQWLGEQTHRLGFVGQHVVLREALREALGPEDDLEAAVVHSAFAWYAWKHVIWAADTEAVSGPDTDQPTVVPSVPMLPAKAQRKGIGYLTNNLDLLMFVVRAAENGVDKEGLDQQISEETPSFSRGTRLNLVAQTTSLGLLAFENGAYKPTAGAGRALLDGDPAPDVLTPIFVRNVFGVAQILDDLRREGRLTRLQIAGALKSYYPRWTTDFAPNMLVAWMRDLELVNVEGVGAGATVSLTEMGETWAAGLPADMKAPIFLLTDERPDEKPDVAQTEADATVLSAELAPPPLAEILRRFKENDALKNLVFSENEVALVHTALHARRGKRFVLLAGLSGTGKTSMARGYARAYCDALGLSLASHFELVAVWPDWTDPTGLLGFVNPLANPPSFQQTTALRLLLNAVANRDKPYFLCLDEMNLARVEHYFAPFLSAMEARERLALHASREAVDGIPPAIPWPENLFIIGTVNMDETTYPFSDKVLDRAFTFEFWDVDLEGWKQAAIAGGESTKAMDAVYPVLVAMTAALKPARRHFGYRTCDEVLGYVSAAGDLATALDAAVLAKVLPKVRGEASGPLPKAIDDALKVCADHGLKASAEKLSQMKATLADLGAVRFWS